MKLECNVQINVRQDGKPSVNIQKSQQAVLTICTQGAVPSLVLYTQTHHHKGSTYPLRNDNLERVHASALREGRCTLVFRQPPHELRLRAEPKDFLRFMQQMKAMLLRKKDEPPAAVELPALATAGVSLHNKAKKVAAKRPRDITLLRSMLNHSKMRTTFQKQNLKLTTVPRETLGLWGLSVLNLSHNFIRSIPAELGDLPLGQVNLEYNRLDLAESWSWLAGQRIRQTLMTLKLTGNRLQVFPYAIAGLTNLTELMINNNSINKLPFAMIRMKRLSILNVSKNKLTYLPGALNRLHFTHLDVTDNASLLYTPFKPTVRKTVSETFDLSVPALFVLAARAIDRTRLPDGTVLPDTLREALLNASNCRCGQLCPTGVPLPSFNSEPIQSSLVVQQMPYISFMRQFDVFCSRACYDWQLPSRENLAHMDFVPV